MSKQVIVERTLNAINQLPEEVAAEISDFADFLAQRHEHSRLASGIQTLNAQSASFDFLKEDEDLYSLSDLKEVYRG